MTDITLHNDRDTSATYVSNHFIDHYMTSANGEYVKIYLYLLRCLNSMEHSFSLSAAADKFEHTEKDVQRALKYWEKMKLLKLEYDEDKKLSGICFLNSSPKEDIVQEAPSGYMTSKKTSPENFPAKRTLPSDFQDSTDGSVSLQHVSPQTVSHRDTAPQKKEDQEMASTPSGPTYTAAQLTAFQEKEDIRELLFVTEHYLKRPLTPTDINTILFWYDELHFSADMIEYLIEYCIGKGHTSIRYMDKVALGWQKEGISTVSQAKRASSAFGQLHFSVMRAFGITGRNLIASETAYIDKWSKTYGFAPDIITEACRRTISSTHQPSFEYADSILGRWHKLGVHHLNDIAKLDSDYQNKKKAANTGNKAASPNRFHNFDQRSYNDYDKLEQQLLGSNGN